ncbi:DUF1405 domain-containing protein [Alteribacter natronophilus]|uniref:DUF1405 domain-containing protein n=1 Tax=Alteribacter natronophilus TaxID=2583810 RepID=UPI00110DC582|nr:DUF1405 domain-containing protein [Alteribacter natronophilus]TMW73579.1 DUF1405 domain-containing protein [Alteribacter natronophilus]
MIEKGYSILGSRWFLVLLLLINIPGTIYGYIWYESQLANTPAKFLIFVPDSPTASLFFVIVLAAFLLKKNVPLVEALAAVTLFKYGIWAVVMIVWAGLAGAEMRWDHYMLIASHLGMAIQGLLYAPFYRIKPWHLIAVAVWTLHNDVIDYIYGMHPYVSRLILPYYSEIAYFTFWLSMLSLLIVYLLNTYQKKRTLE